LCTSTRSQALAASHSRCTVRGDAGEVAKLDDPTRPIVEPLESLQRLVQSQKVIGLGRGGRTHQVEVDLSATTAPLEATALAGPLHQDPPHGLGGGAEEVCPPAPARRLGLEQPQVHLVDQGRGLQRCSWRLCGHPLVGELPQLLVDQREQPLGRVAVTLRRRVGEPRGQMIRWLDQDRPPMEKAPGLVADFVSHSRTGYRKTEVESLGIEQQR
jgi:hypothetical protein